MHNDFYDCGYAWIDEWHASMEHCTLKLDPCPGRTRCKSFIRFEELQDMRKAKEDADRGKLKLVTDIPYEDVEEFARKWNAEVVVLHIENRSEDV